METVAVDVDDELRIVVGVPVSPPRIVIPGKASAPAADPALGLLPLRVVGADVELFEFTIPATLVVLPDPPRKPPGSVPGKVRFGWGEIANCPRASPGGTTTV
jgi:hypothetical protein